MKDNISLIGAAAVIGAVAATASMMMSMVCFMSIDVDWLIYVLFFRNCKNTIIFCIFAFSKTKR